MASTKNQFDTPQIPASEAVMICHSTTRIAAPASLVFRTLRNTETWKDWNKWVPRVNVTYQPPDEDVATAAEIEELVRNTSIAGSQFSDLTDGSSGRSIARRRENERPVDLPPLKLRSHSTASGMSGRSASDTRSDAGSRPSLEASRSGSNGAAVHGHPLPNGQSPRANGLSAAQKYAASQEARKASIASGQQPAPVNNNLSRADEMAFNFPPPPIPNDPIDDLCNLMLTPSGPMPRRSNSLSRTLSHQTPPRTPPGNGSNAAATALQPPNSQSPQRSKSLSRSMSSRRKASQAAAASTAQQKARARTVLLLYGEPSVRVQINTKMTFFVRMNPHNPNDYKQSYIHVTEVSRPDDPDSDEVGLTALTRSKTHTLSRTPVYRIVWSGDPTLASISTIKNGSSFPKTLLLAERVHEIRPIVLGDGTEECEYRTWECLKGPLARVVKKKYANYIQDMFGVWGRGLAEFCEGMGGKVDRRDFTLELEQARRESESAYMAPNGGLLSVI